MCGEIILQSIYSSELFINVRNVLQDVFSDGMNKVSIDRTLGGEALSTQHKCSGQQCWCVLTPRGEPRKMGAIIKVPLGH